ncbi:MAG: hypothetical protein GF350_12155 [Chitinivibrionales bacterium]|nr:hypothetical protein [Chitinivibrionales bacterium]
MEQVQFIYYIIVLRNLVYLELRRGRMKKAHTHTAAVLVLVAICLHTAVNSQVSMTVDYAQESGDLKHFWNETGILYTERFFEPRMRQQLDFMGAIPHERYKIRPLWLLDLIDGTINSDNPSYDFTRLDSVLNPVVHNDLGVIFPLMGPKGGVWDYDIFATDETERTRYKTFVTDVAEHLISKYGAETVRTWMFETNNEPDVSAFGMSNIDSEDFYAYYDACSEGLREADSGLQFGGAAIARGIPSFNRFNIWDHCANGTNIFTGEQGVRLDYITYHKKEVPTEQVNQEIEFIDWIHSNYPSLADVPIINNEGDAQTGWASYKGWRPMPNAASVVANSVNQHIVRIIDSMGVNYTGLARDNIHLGEFGQRVLMVPFGSATRFSLVKLPSYTVLVAMALLGNRRIAVTAAPRVTDDIGIIATKTAEGDIALLVYHDDVLTENQGPSHPVTVTVNNIPFSSAMYTHYRIDVDHSSPYSYADPGDSDNMNQQRLADMRLHDELEYLEEPVQVDISGGTFSTDLDMPYNTVSLLVLTQQPGSPPEAVSNVSVTQYGGMYQTREFLVEWDEVSARNIRTYEILYSTAEDGQYTRVNENDIVEAAYLHSGPATKGHYRVRAVDYWGQAGPAVGEGGSLVSGSDNILSTAAGRGNIFQSGKIIEYHNDRGGAVTLSLYTMKGACVFSADAITGPVVKIDRSGFCPGLYTALVERKKSDAAESYRFIVR